MDQYRFSKSHEGVQRLEQAELAAGMLAGGLLAELMLHRRDIGYIKRHETVGPTCWFSLSLLRYPVPRDYRSVVISYPMHDTATAQLELARSVAKRLLAAGASECLLVGGFVRDHLLGIASKDIDIEVYGLDYEQIVRVLAFDHASVNLVGRSFGVVKVGSAIDVSMPRRESKSDAGHRGFRIDADPTMTPREACARRDFTINAMGMRLDGSIFDPFDGRRDLRQGILRATSPTFREDPLRVLRGMQFTARFGLEMDDATAAMCRDMTAEFAALSPERVWEEWRKWATKGRYPSKGLHVLRQTGWIECFPLLHAMAQTPQDPVWHPEGDVFTHTAYACDAAAAIAQREGFDEKQRLVLLAAALCHDFGKIETTTRNTHGRWIAPGHAERGAARAAEFLRTMRAPEWLVELVVPLVGQHMVMLGMPKDKSPPARVVRRLARGLAPATIRMWAGVCEADSSGRPPRPPHNPVAAWLPVAEALAVEDAQPKPLLLGRHLLPLGYQPGPGLGAVLRAAFEAQLDGVFQDVEEAIHWVRERHPVDGVPSYKP